MKNYLPIVFVALFAICSVDVQARDIYVSPTGSGTSYTSGSPGTAKGGLDLAQAGDTVYFLDGRYTDSTSTWEVAFNTARSGASGNPIYLKAVNRFGAVLVRKASSVPAISLQNRSYISIDGFKTEGSLQVYYCNNITVKNCEVTKGSCQGGDTSLNWGLAVQASNYCLIQNNYVHDMDNSGNHLHNSGCIMLFGGSSCSNNVIEYNTVDGGSTNIYSAFGTKGGNYANNVWRYNFGRNCYGAGFLLIMATQGSSNVINNSFHHNVIVNTPVMFEADSGGGPNYVYNNTFYCGAKTVQGKTVKFMGDYWENGKLTGQPYAIRDLEIYNNLAFNGTMGYNRSTAPTGWISEWFNYCDYNQFYNYTYWAKGSTTTYTLATWRTASTADGIPCDTHSTTNTAGFVNAGGTTAEDYKRTSYITSGRGGSYPAVVGAYVSGNETIGCSFSGSAPVTDTTAPGKPVNIRATVVQ